MHIVILFAQHGDGAFDDRLRPVQCANLGRRHVQVPFSIWAINCRGKGELVAGHRTVFAGGRGGYGVRFSSGLNRCRGFASEAQDAKSAISGRL